MSALNTTPPRQPRVKSAAPPVASAPDAANSGVIAEMASRTGQDRTVESEARQLMIAEAAYYLAESRGFAPGHELEDWLEAEARVDALTST